MNHRNIQKAAVIGAGTMGIGIAQVIAASGFEVLLTDDSEEILIKAIHRLEQRLLKQVEQGRISAEVMKALLERIILVSDLDELAEVDVVIEAVVEQLEVKKELFAQLDQITKKTTILASNTSSLSITAIASATKDNRVMGIHFFNPAPRMPLVEVIYGAETNPQLVDIMIDWLKQLGKEPVKVMDSPGFLVNRVARPFHIEAYRLIGEKLASKEQVDRILRAAGFKMGPFELQDLIGIDINYAASVSVYEGFFHEPRFRPHPKQQEMVNRGALGQKSGRGHYHYEK